MLKLTKHIRTKPLEVLLFSFIFFISWTIMWKTFQLKNGYIEIGSRVWSDFAATIPLIRSFSLGENFPPEYPIFSGPPIRYHFVFFLLVGTLEKAGIPLDWSLNLLSVLGFSLLLTLIYLLGSYIFKSKAVGTLAVILFLFNSSLGFLEFFKINTLSADIFTDIVNNTSFSSFGPYDGKIVSAFWSLNIYTNQRHLAIGYASFVILIYLVYRWSKKPSDLSAVKALLLGLFVGLFPFVNLAVFGMMAIALVTIFFIHPRLRINLIITGVTAIILAVPQILYMGDSNLKINYFNPGYLADTASFQSVFGYWFYNLGLTAILAPLGFIISEKDQRKMFIPFLMLFIVGNLFQLSPEVAANHKFFNLFVIGANFFTAYFLYFLWTKNIAGKSIVIPLTIFLTLTGIVDFFPIVNDYRIPLKDIPKNEASAFIYESTPKDSVILNANFLYDPASIAGRKIYLGWPYFSWSAGYNTDLRFQKMKSILEESNLASACGLLKQAEIDYVELQEPTTIEGVDINYAFFENFFDKIYSNNENYRIYSVDTSCSL